VVELKGKMDRWRKWSKACLDVNKGVDVKAEAADKA